MSAAPVSSPPSNSVHAILSASGAKRWLNCTPSARLEAELPEQTSPFAEEGRLAHSLGELKALKYLKRITPQKYTADLAKLKKDPQYTVEMDSHTDSYLDFIKATIHGYTAPPYVAIERRVVFDEYVPEGFGTGDCIIVGGGTLDIIDFKYGKGVPVKADHSEQLQIYSLGALLAYGNLYRIARVRCTIFQPRLDSVSTWETTPEELRAWGESIKPLARLAFEGGGECKAGDWCQFCRAKAVCRARAENYTALEDFGYKLPPLLSNAEVGEILRRGQALDKWVKALEAYALAEAMKGGEIPGWKVVAGRSTRKFTDTDQVFNTLRAAGYEDAVLYNREPLTLTALEALVTKKKFVELLTPYVVKAPGSPALVSEDDPRQVLGPTAQDDFKDEQQATPDQVVTVRAGEALITGWAPEAAEQREQMTIPQALVDDINKYYGRPPYDGADNKLKGDGFFGSHIRNTYPSEKIKRVLYLMDIPAGD